MSNSRRSNFGKYIVYVDESGDQTLHANDPTYPIFVLAFCVFHQKHYSRSVVPALEEFKFKHFGHDQIVLHAHEIRKKKGAFNIFRSRDEENEFMEELTEIVDECKFVLISCVVDKRKLTKTADADQNLYHIALAACMESLYEFLKEKNEEEKTTHVVFECRGTREDNELELEFRRFCDGQNRLERRLPLEILFGDKKVMSTGLQLADLVARPIGLSYLRPEQGNRAFDVLEEKFYCAGGRSNAGNNYQGVGLKLFPDPESEKPR